MLHWDKKYQSMEATRVLARHWQHPSVSTCSGSGQWPVASLSHNQNCRGPRLGFGYCSCLSMEWSQKVLDGLSNLLCHWSAWREGKNRSSDDSANAVSAPGKTECDLHIGGSSQIACSPSSSFASPRWNIGGGFRQNKPPKVPRQLGPVWHEIRLTVYQRHSRGPIPQHCCGDCWGDWRWGSCPGTAGGDCRLSQAAPLALLPALTPPLRETGGNREATSSSCNLPLELSAP